MSSNKTRNGFIIRSVHKIVAIPAIYDAVQFMVGGTITYHRLRKILGSLPVETIFLDIGGGTGLTSRRVLPEVHYLCLDNDMEKLHGFPAQSVNASALLGDSNVLPIRSKSFDWAMLMAVSHHLTDDAFEQAVKESLRVLKDDGRLLFLDAVWAPRRLPGRFLWWYDRGSNPRTPAQNVRILTKYGNIVYKADYFIYHRYLLCVVEPR